MDGGRGLGGHRLHPLAYHRDVADRLEQSEPQGWITVGKLLEATRAGASGSMWDDEEPARSPSGLLRSAYRLDPAAHPVVHAALARATENLGVGVPVSVYQVERGIEANAGLLDLAGELAVLISGNLIPLLSEDGLCAVLGHELAHHRLWSMDDGRYQVADRLLELLIDDAATPPSYLETHRRYRLATELFADRGAVVACGDLLTAVGALVTTVTGLADVDPAGYLAQAEAADPLSGSRATSHPETVLRAWALGRWHHGTDGELSAGDAAVRALLRPGLDLDALDVFDRSDLERTTRNLLQDLLLDPWWQSEAVLAQARQFFPAEPFPPAGGSDWGSPSLRVRPLPEGLSAPTLTYLAYVLLDLVTADPDLDVETAVARAGRFATDLGLAADFDRVARAELGLSAAAWKRIAG